MFLQFVLFFMTKNKLLFFGYQLDPLDGIFTCYEKILEDGKSKLNSTIAITGADGGIITDHIVELMRKTIKKDLSDVWPRLVNAGKNDAEETKLAFKNLEHLGLGTVYDKKHSNGVVVQHFVKIKHAELINNTNLLKVIQSLGLDLNKTLNAMILSEANQQISTNRQTKRDVT